MKISVVSGGFDPLHSGHISYLKSAKKYGDYLIVLLNSDIWLSKKKVSSFSLIRKKIILKNISCVKSIVFQRHKEGSCINGLKKIQTKYKKDEIIFCNGGDRTQTNIPEMSLSGIEFKFNVGGSNKKNSSSEILKNWHHGSESRIWGSFYNLFVDKNVKVKELNIQPNQGMSFQRHFHRNEIWLVSQGSCKVLHGKKSEKDVTEYNLKKEDIFHVKKRMAPNNESFKKNAKS